MPKTMHLQDENLGAAGINCGRISFSICQASAECWLNTIFHGVRVCILEVLSTVEDNPYSVQRPTISENVLKAVLLLD